MRNLTAALLALAMLFAVSGAQATTTHKKKHHGTASTQTSKSSKSKSSKSSDKGAAPATK